jgi:hypothetical protein
VLFDRVSKGGVLKKWAETEYCSYFEPTASGKVKSYQVGKKARLDPRGSPTTSPEN